MYIKSSNLAFRFRMAHNMEIKIGFFCGSVCGLQHSRALLQRNDFKWIQTLWHFKKPQFRLCHIPSAPCCAILAKHSNGKFWSLSTGTFGQTESWSVHISSSWMHPAVPYEVLIDPLSMPDHKILDVKTHLSDAINPDKTEADRGELEVSCNTPQMIIRAV